MIYFDSGVVLALTTLTGRLVDIRAASMKGSGLCTENVGPEIFGKLLDELNRAIKESRA